MQQFLLQRKMTDKKVRVSEAERKFFDFLKILCDGGWTLETTSEFISVIEYLGLLKSETLTE